MFCIVFGLDSDLCPLRVCSYVRSSSFFTVFPASLCTYQLWQSESHSRTHAGTPARTHAHSHNIIKPPGWNYYSGDRKPIIVIIMALRCVPNSVMAFWNAHTALPQFRRGELRGDPDKRGNDGENDAVVLRLVLPYEFLAVDENTQNVTSDSPEQVERMRRGIFPWPILCVLLRSVSCIEKKNSTYVFM